MTETFSFWRTGDVNGDGLTDVMSAFPGNFGCGVGGADICGAGSCTQQTFATMLSIITELDGGARGTASSNGPVWCSPQYWNGGAELPEPFFVDYRIFTVFNQSSATTASVGDFDGDGRSDWLLVHDTLGVPQFGTALSRGNGDFVAAGFATPDVPVAAINSSPDSALNTLGAADVDRDGIDDAFIVTRSSPQGTQSALVNILWFHGTGDGFFETTPRWLTTSPERLPNYYHDPATQLPVYPKFQVIAADAIAGGNLEFSYISQATPSSEARIVVGSVSRQVSANLGELFAADIAGTGRSEMLRLRRTENGLRIERSREALAPSSDVLPIFLDDWAAYFFDFDSPSCANCSGTATGHQDGKDDLLVLGRDPGGMSFIFPALSRGDGTFLLLAPQAVSLSSSPRSWMVGDTTGDGVHDLVNVAVGNFSTTITTIERDVAATSWNVFANDVPIVGAPVGQFAVNVDADRSIEIAVLSRRARRPN